MKAVTLKHPWPWAICVLGKRIENRRWKPRPSQLAPGQWLAIHGGVGPRTRADIRGVFEEARELAGYFPKKLPPDFRLASTFMPGIVAVAEFLGVTTASDDPWFQGPYGWQIGRVFVLPEAIPCMGKQGLWDLPEDVLGRVREGYRALTRPISRGIVDGPNFPPSP